MAPSLLIVVFWSCGGEHVPPYVPPDPPVETAEPLVAERILAATRSVRDDPTSGEAWGRLAEVYDVNSFEEQALFCYARARELAPDQWRWPYFTGLVLRGSDPASSLDHLLRAAELKPDYAALQFHLGFGYYLAEDFDRSELHFRRALELDPDCVSALLGIARVAVARGEPRVALTHLEKAAGLAADEGAVHLHLAQVYRELGRDAEAEREERLTAASPIPALPDAMAELDDPVRAEVMKRESLTSARQLVEARRLLLLGREDEAAAALEKTLEADPDSVPGLVVSARLLAKRGELERARERLERARALDGDNATIHVDLGNVHALSGRIGAAIEALQRAIEIDPKLARVKGNLAGLLVQAGRREEALELMRDASRELPDDGDILGAYARVLVELGRLEEAEPILRRLMAAEPDRIETRGTLGRILWQQRRYADAIRVFRQGMETAPDERSLSGWLAWSLATCPRSDLRDGREAVTLARRLCEETGFENPEYLDTLAAAQAEAGDFPGAARTVRRGLAIVEHALDAADSRLPRRQRRRYEELLTEMRSRLALYERGVPYRSGG